MIAIIVLIIWFVSLVSFVFMVLYAPEMEG